jgi:hypothetical protein
MTKESVYISIKTQVKNQVVHLFPKYRRFVDERGVMYSEMKKAVYGCIQARSMWFKLLINVLREFGYERCYPRAYKIPKVPHICASL